MHAIEILADLYPRTVTEALQFNTDDFNLILESNTLFFQIKDYLPLEERQYILYKILPRLYRHAKKVYNLIDRSKYPKRVIYSPGLPWDLENTITNYLLSGHSSFTYKHVICEQRKPKENNVILLIDTSHSVLNHLKLIILTSILFTMTVNLKDLAIISFDTQPNIIKAFSDSKIQTWDLIKNITNIRSGGKTNIFEALNVVKKEFSHRISPKKTLIMISDLLATSGLDFLPILRRLPDIRIIITPRRQTLQLTAPLLGILRRLPNIRLYPMPADERMIPNLLEHIIFD
ncbi:MAG: VWA domain-containing protein [Candidatus Hodarchaeota archaeon]